MLHVSSFKPNEKGFTLIELLVVITIIGLLVSIVSVALSAQRLKARDTRRISDMKQIKSGMDLYFADGSGYPDSTAWVVGSTLSCGGNSIMRVPDDPAAPVYHYLYTAQGNSNSGCGVTVRGGYDLEFYVENKGQWYIMNEDGNVREKVSGNLVSFDSLL